MNSAESFYVKWIDPNGVPRGIDISRLAEGRVSGKQSARKTYTGRPKLTAEISIALEQQFHDLALGTARDKLKALTHFYTFLDKLEFDNRISNSRIPEDAGGEVLAGASENLVPPVSVESLSDLPDNTWLLFSLFLRAQALRSRVPLVALVNAQEIIEEARRIKGLAPLRKYRLSTRAESRGKLHPDIDHEALRYIHRVAINEVRRSNTEPLRVYFEQAAENFEDSAQIPPNWGDTNEGCRKYVYDYLNKRLRGGCGIHSKEKSRFASSSSFVRKRKHATCVQDQNLSHYIDLIIPDSSEVLAGFIIVAARTGWLDSAYSFDLNKPWVQELKPTSVGWQPKKRYSIRSIRPKTGRFVVHLSTNGTYSPYKILKWLERRTAFVRSVAADMAESIRARTPNLSDGEIREMRRLEAVSVSPFAYMPRGRDQTPRRLFEAGMVDYRDGLEKLISRAAPLRVQGLGPAAHADLQARAMAVKLSDLRDAHLEGVWRKTGNMHAVQLSAGHKSSQTTLAYLNRRQVRMEQFRRYAHLMEIITDEVLYFGTLDPSVIFLRVRLGRGIAIDERTRKDLSLSRVGIHCVNPFDPPRVSAGTIGAGRCELDLCVMCKNGLLFVDQAGVFESLALRYASLRRRILSMPVASVSGSLEDFEVYAIDLVMSEYYYDRRSEFTDLVAEFIAEAGRKSHAAN